MGSNLPVSKIEGCLKRVWANYDIERIVDSYEGLLMVRFELTNNRDVVCKGHYFFNKKPVIVRA